MKILISNDDGIRARGILQLALKLSKEHDVTVYAPADEQSCKSHAINFFSPIAVKKYSTDEVLTFQELRDNDKNLTEEIKKQVSKIKFFHIEGTPCDAVKLGLELIESGKPDLVISGINNCMNLGTDCLYSGTVNAAIEGSISKVRSVAVSMDCNDKDYDFACEFILKNVKKFYQMLPDYKTILNINFPHTKKEKLRGAVITSTGERIFDDQYQYIKDKGYMVTGRPISIPNDNFADVVKATEGYITIAPLKIEFNDWTLFNKLKDENFDF